MRNPKHAAWILALALLAASCSIVEKSGYVRPGTSLGKEQTFFVVMDGEGRTDTGTVVVDRLKALDYDVRSGPRADVPANTDVIVIYKDYWVWDFMLSLKVDFRNARTNALMATGQTLRNSLARTSPDEMVDEALAQVLAKSGPMTGGAR